MSNFEIIELDFADQRINLNGNWIPCVSSTENCTVRVQHSITLPPRSENVVIVHAAKSQPLLTADFEPKSIHGISGVYATDCRVIPDIEGKFHIPMLNVTSQPVFLHSRLCNGTLISLNNTLHQVSSHSEPHSEGSTPDITMEPCPSAIEQNLLCSLVAEYSHIREFTIRDAVTEDGLQKSRH